jgi:hypothetical protein
MLEILPLPALSPVPNFIKDLRFTNQCGYFGRSPYAFHVVAVSLAEVIDVAVDEVTLLAIEAFPRLLVHSGKDVVPGPGIAADIVGLGIQFGQRYLGVGIVTATAKSGGPICPCLPAISSTCRWCPLTNASRNSSSGKVRSAISRRATTVF